jgi:excisionase family DNA binding protein
VEVDMKSDATMPPIVPFHGLMKPNALAEFLAVSARTVRRLAASGQIPRIKLGRNLSRYHPGQVLDALMGTKAEGDRE